MRILCRNRGFTLIELLIVITIIGILAVAFLPSILNAPIKARDTARIAHLKQISDAIEAYNLDGNGYPLSSGSPAGCTNTTWLKNVMPYLSGAAFPTDPSNNDLPSMTFPYNRDCKAGEYLYFKFSKNSAPLLNYALVAKVENKENGNADKDDIPKTTAKTFVGADSGEYYVFVK